MLVFTTFKPRNLLRNHLKFLRFVYKQYYNSNVVKKDGVFMWKNIFQNINGEVKIFYTFRKDSEKSCFKPASQEEVRVL